MLRNPIRALLDLLPSYPLQIGTVSASADDVHTVSMLGGGVIVARGSAAIGDQVFVRNEVVEGVAPQLPVVLIDV